MEKILISKEDVNDIRAFSDTFDKGKFDAWVKDIQRTQLSQILGKSLWTDMFNNLTDAKYITLIDGEQYLNTENELINYFGLKPFIIYHFLALFMSEGALSFSNTGAQTFNEEQSTLATAEGIRNRYKEQAVQVGNDVITYLEDNSTTYPLWKSRARNNRTDFVLNVI